METKLETPGSERHSGLHSGLAVCAFVCAVLLCIVVLSGSARAERARLAMYNLECGTEWTVETGSDGLRSLELTPDGYASVYGYIVMGDERKAKVSAGFDDLSEGFPGTLWARMEWPAARTSGPGWALAGYLDASAGDLLDPEEGYLRFRTQAKAQRETAGILPAKLSALAFVDGKWFLENPERTYILRKVQGTAGVDFPGPLGLSASVSTYWKEFPSAQAWTSETFAATAGVSGLSVGPIGVKVNGQATSKRYPHAPDKDYIQSTVSLDLSSGARGGVRASLGASFRDKDYPSNPTASGRIRAFDAGLSLPGSMIGGRCEGVGIRAYYSVSEYSDLSVRTYLSAGGEAEFGLAFADGDKGSLAIGLGFSERSRRPGADGDETSGSGNPDEEDPDLGLPEEDGAAEAVDRDVTSRMGLSLGFARKLDEDTQFNLSGRLGWQRRGPEDPYSFDFAVSASLTWRLTL